MPDFITKVRNRIFKQLKGIFQFVLFPNLEDKIVAFIVGCERSGITMITKIFEKYYFIHIYGEFTELRTKHHIKLGLNPLSTIAKEFKRDHGRTMFLKQLVQIRKVHELFYYFLNSKPIWAFRNYKDVATSGRQFLNNWRSERVSESTVNIICKCFSEIVPAKDVATLFLYSPNMLSCQRNLDENDNVHMSNYDEMVLSSQKTKRRLYAFIGAKSPKGTIFSEIYQSAVRKAKDIRFFPEVVQLCESLCKVLIIFIEITLINKKESPWQLA